MVEGLPGKTARARETHPAFSRDRFESTLEFANFKRGMKALLAVPKSELDELVRKAKAASPRAGNQNAAGRKPKLQKNCPESMESTPTGDNPSEETIDNSPAPSPPKPAIEQTKMAQRAEDITGRQESPTAELKREFKLFECLSLGIQVLLALVGFGALYIYNGQLIVMQGQLNQMKSGSAQTDRLIYAATGIAGSMAESVSKADAAMNASIEAFRIEQRPYLILDGSPHFLNPTLSINPEINVAWRNVGKTPARKVQSFARFMVYRGPHYTGELMRVSELEFEKLTLEAKHTHQEGFDLAPGQQNPFGTKSLDAPLTAEDLPKIANTKEALVVIGLTRYRDHFGRMFQTDFCMYFFGPTNSPWHYCDARNTIR